MTALSDLLNAYLPDPKEVSNRKLATMSEGKLSRQTIDNYRNGKHPAQPSDDVLMAFHDLIPELSIQRLRAAADLPPGEPERWEPPAAANLMNKRQREAVDELINSFIHQQGSTDAIPIDPPTPTGTPPETVKDEEDESPDKPEVAAAADSVHDVALSVIDDALGNLQVEDGDERGQEAR